MERSITIEAYVCAITKHGAIDRTGGKLIRSEKVTVGADYMDGTSSKLYFEVSIEQVAQFFVGQKISVVITSRTV